MNNTAANNTTAAPAFDVGDVALLRSGGPAMTVTGVEGETVRVCWFPEYAAGSGFTAHAASASVESFPARALTLADSARA